MRLTELKRFALYESTDAHDELFIKGWIENPLALQGSLGTSAMGRWIGGWVVVVDGLPGPWAQDRFRARLAPLPRGGGWVRGGGVDGPPTRVTPGGFNPKSHLHRVLLPYKAVYKCLKCAATAHLEALEQRSVFEFDMTPALSESMWRLQNGQAAHNFAVAWAQVPRIAMFELEIAHDERVHRYVLRPPEGQHRKRAVLHGVLSSGL